MTALFHLDAFTDRPFSGNPAAVVPLDHWPTAAWMQAVAAENNLSETAFLVPDDSLDYRIRWFTPTTEVDLCGHATLAAAWVVFHRLDFAGERIRFASASGPLAVARDGDWLSMDFPSRPARPVEPAPGLLPALGIPAAVEVLQARDTLVILEDENAVRGVAPDFAAIAGLDTFAVMVSAPGEDRDFVCRFFAPARGLNEDPVTGSAYCTLTPFWAERLGRATLTARQLSSRGGDIRCRLNDDRVAIAGRVVCYLEGKLRLDPS